MRLTYSEQEGCCSVGTARQSDRAPRLAREPEAQSIALHPAEQCSTAPPRSDRLAPPMLQAFTLIELMVVLAIIGIMTAMIIPEMRGTYQDALLRSTSRELVSVFNVAYSRAVSLNQLHRVRLDTSTGRYVIERRLREEGRENFVPLQDVPDCQGVLDTRISIQIRAPAPDLSATTDAGLPPAAEPGSTVQEVVDSISFYPDGTADARELLLRDQDGFRLALRVNPVTARVDIAELERDSPGGGRE
jgi:type II secretion system protein H